MIFRMLLFELSTVGSPLQSPDGMSPHRYATSSFATHTAVQLDPVRGESLGIRRAGCGAPPGGDDRRMFEEPDDLVCLLGLDRVPTCALADQGLSVWNGPQPLPAEGRHGAGSVGLASYTRLER